MMSNDGLIIEYMDMSHIYLALPCSILSHPIRIIHIMRLVKVFSPYLKIDLNVLIFNLSDSSFLEFTHANVSSERSPKDSY